VGFYPLRRVLIDGGAIYDFASLDLWQRQRELAPVLRFASGLATLRRRG
jgi:hypothetical protein